MPRVNVNPTKDLPSHDVSLADDSRTIGLIFERDVATLQEIPVSETARQWSREQKAWYGGMGKDRYEDDPNGFFDSYAMWTMTEGKLMPMPQWYYGSGYRNADSSMPGDGKYQKIDKYIAIKFTAGASYNAKRILLWLDWEGKPGALTWGLYNDSAGDPGTAIETGTLTRGNATRQGPSRLSFSSTNALTASTDYHVKIYHAGGASSYWRVLTDADGAGSQTSTDDAAWTAADYSMYYRVEDSNLRRQFKFFNFKAALYAVSIRESGANSELYINGDRGTANSSTASTLTDTSSGVSTGWTTNQWANAYVRIWQGTGTGQVRQIASNTGTQLTVTDDWDINPSTDSKYVIYGTGVWQSLTAGLGVVTGQPAVAGNVVYFPQGDTTIREMEIDTSADYHGFGNNGSNTADLIIIFWNNTNNEARVVRADADGARISWAALKDFGTALTFKAWKRVGFPSADITNMIKSNDNLLIFKEDGIWSLTPNKTILEFRSDLDSAQDVSNGVAAFLANQELWFTWSHSIQRQIGDDISDMLLYRAGTQGLRRPGIPAGAVAGVGWRFFAIDGERNNISSVICHNGMGWHELFRGWHSSARIQNVHWKANPGARSQLWFDVNGELCYINFPLYAANPLNDSSLSFQHYSSLTTSTIDANEVNLNKLIDSQRINLTDEPSSEVVVEWQVDEDLGTSNWYPLGDLKNTQREEFGVKLGQVQGIRLRFNIYTTTATDPPVIKAYELSGWIVQKLKYQWVASFHVGEYQVTKDGNEDFSPDEIYQFLREAHEKGKVLTLRSVVPTMDDKKVIVSAPAVHKEWVRAESGQPTWEGTIDVQFREL